MSSQDFSHPIAIGASVALHLAIGLALFAAAVSGPQAGRALHDTGKDMVVVNLVAFPSGGGAPTDFASNTPGKPADEERLRPSGEQPQAEPTGSDVDLGARPSGADSGPGRLTVISSSALADRASPSTGAEMEVFRNRLLEHIERYRRYPPEAQRAAVEGVVQVHFVMDRNGGVRDAWIERSSGSSVLDSEAVAAVRRAAPLPTMPYGWPDALDVTLPIGFALQ